MFGSEKTKEGNIHSMNSTKNEKIIFGYQKSETNNIDSVKIYLEAWKRVVDTQEHFNDIRMRIRGMFITTISGCFLFASYLLKDPQPHSTMADTIKNEGYIIIPVLGIFITIGLICLFAEQTYRNFLKSSVEVGEHIEKRLKSLGYKEINLAKTIRKNNNKACISSRTRFLIFYTLPIIIFGLIIFLLASHIHS